jgi:hypothetical protein
VFEGAWAAGNPELVAASHIRLLHLHRRHRKEADSCPYPRAERSSRLHCLDRQMPVDYLLAWAGYASSSVQFCGQQVRIRAVND